MMRMLVVIEEGELANQLGNRLNSEGYVYDLVSNAEDAAYYLDIRRYDLILAQWQFAKDDGLLEMTQNHRKPSPVIVMAATDDSQIEIAALEQGADDYLRIPFNEDVLMARIKHSLQRLGIGNQFLNYAGLEIDIEQAQVRYNGNTAELAGKPLEVLCYLVQRPEQIVSKEQILDAIWEEPELVTPNVIEAAINQIRQKIDKRLGIDSIETVPRRGYRFSLPK
ncbi:response regulator transcription factor [Thiomicrorhabdus immobilis]|nr:response regulator transcription factor [Thiomicrorhabdus immobilis]